MNKQITKAARIVYEKYKLDWMLQHGYTLQDLIRELQSYSENCDNSMSLSSLYKEWECNSGFGGETWACFDEFCDSELRDLEYVKGLLSENEFKQFFADCELELNRAWIYDENDEVVGETNFVIKEGYFEEIFEELFAEDGWTKETINDFLREYEPETDGEKVYEKAKSDNALVEDIGRSFYRDYKH